MKKLLLFFIFSSKLMQGQEITVDFLNSMDSNIYSQIIASSHGDLDNDKVDELLLVVNRLASTLDNIPRNIILLKKKEGSWVKWLESSTEILGSGEGGVMGDPFEDAYIEDNEIHISHSGGSRWRWSYHHTYSFRKNLFLLKSYYSYWGALCESKTEIIFNLISGVGYYYVDVEECPEGFGDNSYMKESLPLKEDFFRTELHIDLFSRTDSIYTITTPLNNIFTLPR
mgnify:FL=1|jgi:hypothetical protein